MTVHLILIVLALLCFIAAALGVPSRVNLTAAGLALLTLTLLI
jgi:hypothetical protein